MGRYVTGDAGFSYKYVFGEQDDNLIELASASGAGVSALVPVFEVIAGDWPPSQSVAGWGGLEGLQELRCMAVLEELRREGRLLGGEARSLLDPDLAFCAGIDPGSFEFAMYAVAENIVQVLLRFDVLLPLVPGTMWLSGRGHYRLTREEWPAMLAYVNGFRADKPLTVEKLREARPKQEERWFSQLKAKEAWLPWMGLCVLLHAVRHDLDSLEVWDTQTFTRSTNFWSLAQEWGQAAFEDPETPEAQRSLARGMALLMALEGDPDEGPPPARTRARLLERAGVELQLSLSAGEPRAERYLAYQRWRLSAESGTPAEVPSPVLPLRVPVERTGEQGKAVEELLPALWRQASAEIRKWCTRYPDRRLMRGYWDEILEARGGESTESEVVLTFPDRHGTATTCALVARHWAELALHVRAERVRGWKLQLPDLAMGLRRSSARVVYAQTELCVVDPTGKRLDAIFARQVVEVSGLPAHERLQVEWVALTGLCQCSLCKKLGERAGLWVSPREHLAEARVVAALLASEPEIVRLSREAHLASQQSWAPPELLVLEDWLEQRGRRLPRPALVGLLGRP
jgi:hypothetical protein